MGATNLYIEDRIYPILRYGIGSPDQLGRSQMSSSNDYWFIMNGVDDGYFIGWCVTGTVKPGARLISTSDDGTYECNFDQVFCSSYYQGQASQDPDNPIFFGFSLSAENIRKVATY